MEMRDEEPSAPSHTLPVTEEEDDSLHSNQDQWLTLRRRCELCKQRKVSIPRTIYLSTDYPRTYLKIESEVG